MQEIFNSIYDFIFRQSRLIWAPPEPRASLAVMILFLSEPIDLSATCTF